MTIPNALLQAWRQAYTGPAGRTTGVPGGFDGYDAPGFSLQRIREVITGREGNTSGVPRDLDGYDDHSYSLSAIRAALGLPPDSTDGRTLAGYDSPNYSLQAIRRLYDGGPARTPGIPASFDGYDAPDYSLARIAEVIAQQGIIEQRDLATVEAADRYFAWPTEIFDGTQSWIAVACATTWDADDPPTSFPSVFRVDDNEASADLIRLLFIEASLQYNLLRLDAGAGSSRPGFTERDFLAGDRQTLIAAWTATEIKLSEDGSVFTSTTTSGSPAISGLPLYVGSDENGASLLEADLYWAAMGLGTLNDAQAAELHSLGPAPAGLLPYMHALTVDPLVSGRYWIRV